MDSLLLSLFACPKSNQKRQPERKQPLSGGEFQFGFWGYCDEGLWSYDALIVWGETNCAVLPVFYFAFLIFTFYFLLFTFCLREGENGGKAQ
jgi:hypothetical protein